MASYAKNKPNSFKTSLEKIMRAAIQDQLQLGELDIANIKLDPRSRDDIPQILRGLQHLYIDKKLREQLFQILEKLTSKNINTELGRPA